MKEIIYLKRTDDNLKHKIQEMNTSFETFISSILFKIFNSKCD